MSAQQSQLLKVNRQSGGYANTMNGNSMSQVLHEPGNYRLNELTTLLQKPTIGSHRKYRGRIHQTNILCADFDNTLAKMNSRKSSIGPNNPTSWIETKNQSLTL